MTPQFNKIAVIDFGYGEEFYQALQILSRAQIEIIEAGNTEGDVGADALVCSWKDALGRDHLERFPNLSYIATRATSTSNIDLEYATEHNIPVDTIAGYGDQATAEFVLQQLFATARNQGRELCGKTVGFLGFGNVPKLISEPLKALGTKTCYYTPSEEQTQRLRQNVPYVSKAQLLQSDFVSVHTPARIISLSKAELLSISPETGLVITTMGLPFEEETFRMWKREASNLVVMDKVAAGDLDFSDLQGVAVIDVYAARTVESKREAERQILKNIRVQLTQEIS